MWPGLASTLAWSVGVIVSLIVGLLALRFVGAGLDHEPALPVSTDARVTPPRTSPPDVGPSPAPTATPTATPPPASPAPQSAATGADRLLTTAGGTVLAHCVNGNAFLVSWSPGPGFEAGDIVRGPAAVARVSFETTGIEYHVSVTCAGDVPQSTVHKDN
jgi:hypothetical protein